MTMMTNDQNAGCCYHVTCEGSRNQKSKCNGTVWLMHSREHKICLQFVEESPVSIPDIINSYYSKFIFSYFLTAWCLYRSFFLGTYKFINLLLQFILNYLQQGF